MGLQRQDSDKSKSSSVSRPHKPTLFQELMDYQKILKAERHANKIYSVQEKECQELIHELHFEYYDELL